MSSPEDVHYIEGYDEYVGGISSMMRGRKLSKDQ